MAECLIHFIAIDMEDVDTAGLFNLACLNVPMCRRNGFVQSVDIENPGFLGDAAQRAEGTARILPPAGWSERVACYRKGK
jgi:hypothetical protein